MPKCGLLGICFDKATGVQNRSDTGIRADNPAADLGGDAVHCDAAINSIVQDRLCSVRLKARRSKERSQEGRENTRCIG